VDSRFAEFGFDRSDDEDDVVALKIFGRNLNSLVQDSLRRILELFSLLCWFDLFELYLSNLQVIGKEKKREKKYCTV
jgi:hypothetical protein